MVTGLGSDTSNLRWELGRVAAQREDLFNVVISGEPDSHFTMPKKLVFALEEEMRHKFVILVDGVVDTRNPRHLEIIEDRSGGEPVSQADKPPKTLKHARHYTNN